MFTTELEIDEFVYDYQRSHIINKPMVKFIMNKVLEYEKKYQKFFYEFSTEEILNIYKEQNLISELSVTNWNLTLKFATRWTAHKKNRVIRSKYEGITEEQLKSCITGSEKRYKLLSRKNIEEIQKQLYNWTDKAILELLFLGVKGDLLYDICFMSEYQLNTKFMYLNLGRNGLLQLDWKSAEILEKAFSEDELMTYTSTIEISRVQNYGIFKYNPKKDNLKDINDPKERYKWLQRRIWLISGFVKIPLTAESIYDSGCYWRMKEKENIS